jgi:hypothetical protein
MKTTINGHSVEFTNARDGRGFDYALRVDDLYISNFETFEGAEKRAHAICQHYPTADLGKKLEILNTVFATSSDTTRIGFANRQELLGKLGSLAVPPAGHSCPDCSCAGTLYCVSIAAERLRGSRS